MPLKIIKATDAITVEHPVFMIIGQPGICKSSLGYSSHDPITLDFDGGAARAVNRRTTVQIDQWSDLSEINREFLAPYRTVVVDTVGRALDAITADIAENDPKKVSGGALNQQGWGVLKNRFKSWIALMRSYGKDVVLIAHDKEDKDGDSRIVRADIQGGSLAEVMKISDFVGYVYMNGKERIIDFNPTDRWVGKNPGRWPAMKIPEPGKATDFLAKLIDAGRDALGKIGEASADAANSVIDWKNQIDDFKTADDFNAAIPKIKALHDAINPQVAKLLLDAAKAKGIPFDGEKKQFIQTKTEEPVGAGSGKSLW
jgi:hypothetical protein